MGVGYWKILDNAPVAETASALKPLWRLSYLRHIQKWRLKGYRVSLFFLTLPNVETAIARVAERVRQGGHNIPEPVIRRRFYSGWWNFTNAYQAAVDDWAVHDNSGNMPVLVEWEEAQ
jgi:predicted ABC-type ATPase